jgi:hypothetical protein
MLDLDFKLEEEVLAKFTPMLLIQGTHNKKVGFTQYTVLHMCAKKYSVCKSNSHAFCWKKLHTSSNQHAT